MIIQREGDFEICVGNCSEDTIVSEPKGFRSGRQLWKDMYRILKEELGWSRSKVSRLFNALWALIDTYDRFKPWFYSAPSALLADKYLFIWAASVQALWTSLKPVSSFQGYLKELVDEYVARTGLKPTGMRPKLELASAVVAGAHLMRTSKTPLPALYYALWSAPDPTPLELYGAAAASLSYDILKKRLCPELRLIAQKLKRKPPMCEGLAERLFSIEGWKWPGLSPEDVRGVKPELLLWIWTEGWHPVPDEVLEPVREVREVLRRSAQFRAEEEKVKERLVPKLEKVQRLQLSSSSL